MSCSFRGDEEDSSAGSIAVEGAVKVHDPVLGSGVGWRILDLGPLINEVSQCLRLDGGSWRELYRECTEFHRPFDDSAIGVLVVQVLASTNVT